MPVAFKVISKLTGELKAMRQVMEYVMAKVIEFYVPDLFPKAVSTARTEPGKVIEFRLSRGKGLAMRFRESAAGDPHSKEGAIPIWTFCKSLYE